MELSGSYIYDRAPLILLFVTGYILFRVIALAGLPEYLAARATRFSRGRADLLLLSLIVVSAFLSMFIPNAVTVLAMIPVIRRLDAEMTGMTTGLTLSVIYGANIGGMGSLIGSPANLLLLGALDYFDVAGRERITFFNWFEWALPLVVLFLLFAWLVVRFAVPKIAQPVPVPVNPSRLRPEQQRGGVVFSSFLLFWIASSILTELSAVYKSYEPIAAICFTGGFVCYVFGRGLLRLADLLQGIPRRGLLFLCLLGVFIAVVRGCRLDEWAAQSFTGLIGTIEQSGTGGFVVYLVTAAVVILLTEFLSNTVVSTAFFAVTVHVSSAYGMNPLPLMVLVSAASTCAFMTPVATPCNSLAVGEMRGMSLKTMLFLGLILNLLGAGLLAIWIWTVVPIVYGWLYY
ncbi:SLC13 family permease [Maridesulfovibrio sp. FT414]|uniref:SLC13 family permease n=1 Tax=Maridesulfovibrio sp. FT414 TaxID=2979469 RepID=UPI003D8045EA